MLRFVSYTQPHNSNARAEVRQFRIESEFGVSARDSNAVRGPKTSLSKLAQRFAVLGYPVDMPRRSSFRDDLKSITAAVDSIGRTPLSPIADVLRSEFGPFYEARGSSSAPDIEISVNLSNAIFDIFGSLPTSFGPRFDFDAAFIRAMVTDWNPKIELPSMLIPKHNEDWGFQELHLPSFDPQRIPVVRMFLFPGQDSLDDIDLLAYPWLAHEMAHCLLFLYPTLFPSRFTPLFDRYVRRNENRPQDVA